MRHRVLCQPLSLCVYTSHVKAICVKALINLEWSAVRFSHICTVKLQIDWFLVLMRLFSSNFLCQQRVPVVKNFVS